MTIVASNSLTLSNVSDGTGIANVTNFYLASNQSTGIEKPAEIVNLIRNGAYPTNTNYWSGAMIVSQHNFYYNGQKKLFLLQTTGTSEIVASSNRFDVKRNTNYSLSFYALAGGNVKDSDVFFLGRKSNETNDFTSTNLIIGRRRFSGSKAEYVTITFNSGDNDNGYIRFDNNGSSDGINAVLFFGEVMLVEGGEPKPWVAAIEDSGWTRVPQQITYTNRFLWNYRIDLYTDGVTKSIEPTVIGVYGEKGDMGKSVWTYPYDRGGNRLGNWWSDLKPTPTTNNPPKVGDTIIDLVGNIYQITNVVVSTTQGGGGGLFDYGPMLTSVKGADGAPGKIVSDTEPTTRFKGLTWKYSGTTDLTASDGTVILSGTEYYWSGTHWILNEINAHNINGDNLSVTNGTFTDGKIKSTWNSGTASGSTEIENSHINMSATNSSSKVTNSLGLDIQQGFGMRWTDPASNQSRSVSLDYGNLAFDRNGVAAGLNFDGANLSSSMPIQAPNTIVKSTQFSVSGIGIRLDRLMSFVAVTFFGQASSTISNSPTINNMIPAGFRPINPYSIDYMVPGNSANSGYIYFNPDGSIRIMATINSGYYIRGTRLYITNDVYPS